MNFVFVLAQRVRSLLRSNFCFKRGGSDITLENSLKDKNPQKEQFNIMIRYDQRKFLQTKKPFGFSDGNNAEGKVFSQLEAERSRNQLQSQRSAEYILFGFPISIFLFLLTIPILMV